MSLSRVRAALLLSPLFAYVFAGCANDPYPDQPARREVSAELFHFVCKRVAREYAEGDLSGARFDAACDAPAEADLADTERPRLAAILQRREAIVAALEQAIGDQPVGDSGTFEDGELKAFLQSLVPFYDDDRLPGMTQKLAGLLERVLDANDPRARAVIDRLAAISPRVGYRPAPWALGAIRPFLSYDGLDELSRVLLGLFGEGGAAHEEFEAMLRAAALELAEEAEVVPDRDDTTLHVLLDLLLTADPALANPGDPQLLTVRRDARGLAQAKLGAPFVDADGDGLADVDDSGRFMVEGSDDPPSPFKKARGIDAVAERDDEGRALDDEGAPMFEYYDANATVLAAAMREAKPLVERSEPGEPSALENLSRGLRALLGPNTARSYDFGTQPYAFEGPDLSKSPVLDLLHAVSYLLKQPETKDALALLSELMRDDELESIAAGPLYAGLRIDERADAHPEAVLTGFDGKPGSPHEFWDDALAVGARMLKRPKLIEGLVRGFGDPRSAAQGQLFGTWMKYNDVVSYKNAPIMASGEGGKFTEAEAADLNASVSDFVYQSEIDRSKPDTGMHRSIWQRTMSLLHSINGNRMCNKEGAVIAISDPLPLQFPLGGTYKECDFLEIPDPGEAYAQSILQRMKVVLKDAGLNDLAALGSAIGLVGSTAEIQEKESQLKDFDDTPSPESLARFMFGPQNKFTADLLGDVLTVDRVPLKLYEPYSLFPMEVLDPAALVDGKPQSFISAGVPLLTAFDDNELREGDKLIDGYMFGHLLDLFHMNWSSPREETCPAMPEVGREGCTQSVDPAGKFYARQSNVVSYEPLIHEAMVDERLTQILQRSSAALAGVTINGKDGIKVLSDFVKLLLASNDQLATRSGRKWAATNTCVIPAGASNDVPPAQCDCPTGSTPDGELCKLGARRVPRGKIVPLSPAYLLLDALKGFDQAFEDPENQERLAPWRAARSILVDRFLGTEQVDGDNLKFRFSNQNARKIAVKALSWAEARIAAHESAGDLAAWANGLTARAVDVLEHPLVASGLDVLDEFWDDPRAGDEFAAVASYLMDPTNKAFEGIVVATADTLTFLDREPELTPIVRFASLAVAPNAFEALDTGAAPDVEQGVVLRGLELTRQVVDLHTDTEVPSTIGKLLKNLVLANDVEGSAIEGQAPIEVFIDSIAEVNRVDASQPAEQPMAADDQRSALTRLSEFLLDPERGLERIYRVIKSRELSK
jgi:hypothetical protein